MLQPAGTLPGYELWLALPEEIRVRVPAEDAWALDEEEAYAFWGREGLRRQQLAERLMDPRNPRLAEERGAFKMACASDPVFYARNCVWTLDPEAPIQRPRELPYVPFRYVIDNYLTPRLASLRTRRTRRVTDKGRRLQATIGLSVWKTWAFRFVPGYKTWVSSYGEDMIDRGDSWDPIFGKMRYIWRMNRRFFPWLFPELPPSSAVNQRFLLRFPEWRVDGVAVDEGCWINEILGLMPNEVAGRGGACIEGDVDEAGWCEDLDVFYESIEAMTPHLNLQSTPPRDSQHLFARLRRMGRGWETHSVHWTMDPRLVRGIYWDEAAEYRGPWTQKWRSPWYNAILEENQGQLHIVSRNYDLDYQSSAGSKVFLGFDQARQCGTHDPKAADWDLYDPEWPTYVWYDVGRGDPWAFLWVQISDATQEVRIVDYWMRKDVTIDWWVPMLGGWNIRRTKEWLTAPDRLPWRTAVPWAYSMEEVDIIERWYGRRRPKFLVGDIQGRQRSGSAQYTVEDILRFYGFMVRSSSAAHNMENWIDHANSVLPRVRISGRLVGLRPGGLWPSMDEVFQYWQRAESTEMGRAAIPLHNDYSHPGTAFIYGVQHLPKKVRATIDPGTRGRVVEAMKPPGQARLGPRKSRHTGWL